jgi:tetratricopeptide (TPR) repeat protein
MPIPEPTPLTEKAIALDGTSPACYLSLGWVKLGYEWDWDGADAALKKAADLQPGSAVVLSYRVYLYECLGRLDEAIALTQEASVLDPVRTNCVSGVIAVDDRPLRRSASLAGKGGGRGEKTIVLPMFFRPTYAVILSLMCRGNNTGAGYLPGRMLVERCITHGDF